MFRKYLAQKFGFPLQDYLRKTNIIRTLPYLRESQFWPEEKISEYQLEKLKKLVDFTLKNVPYYEKLFNSIKLRSSDIKTLTDIQKIPILTKEIVREENKNLIARNFNKKLVRTGKTGGTTGTPIIVYKDTTDRTFTWASYYRWYDWMGINYYDRAATLWGARTVLSNSLIPRIKNQLTNNIQNKLYINWFKINISDLPKIYSNLVKFKPVILKGYLSALLNLASYIEENELVGLKPKVLSTTTETLLPHNRKYLEDVFKASIFDQYGCGEISGIAYECSMHNGLHVNQEHVFQKIFLIVLIQ